jgi:hypothetical protein
VTRYELTLSSFLWLKFTVPQRQFK